MVLLNMCFSSKFRQIVTHIRAKHTLSYVHNNGKYPLIYRTIGQELSRVASEHGDHEAIIAIEEDKRLTFEQLKCQADNLAAGFLNLGLQRGDRVALWAPNVISWPVVFFAAARAGLILVALNPSYQPLEIKYCLQKVGVKALVTSESFRNQSYYNTLIKIVPELQASTSGKVSCEEIPSLLHVIMDTKTDHQGILKLNDIATMPSSDEIQHVEDIQNTISPDSGCSILFSSGTTGKPKAALLKHIAFVNNGFTFGEHVKLANERICMPVSFFHVFGVITTIMASLSHQATIILPSSTYNPERNLFAIRDQRCSVIYGTPTMHVDLLSKKRQLCLDIDIKVAVSGGALCPPKLLQDLKTELGAKKAINVYGMTENSSVSFGVYKDDLEEDMDTVGRVNDHVEAKVIDKDGNLVPFGEPGELCVRGYLTMLGYWEDEAKTKEALGSDGWLKTGDQFILQENGYGKVVGRFKDMIIRGGENIFPREIENLLMTCPQIAEAYVVGVPDERLGEELCAFVRLHEGVEIYSIKEAREFCNGKIAYFKIPRYLRVVEEFPKTVSGKIQKFKLQEQFKVNENEGK